MRISTKGRYAIKMLIDIAQHQSGEYLVLRDIAQRQKISKKYLEQIVSALNKGRILQSNRGFQGGYKLAIAPDKCSIGEILRITEGSLSPVPELDDNYNPDDPTCYVWTGLKSAIENYLDNITLQDILDSIVESYANDYVI